MSATQPFTVGLIQEAVSPDVATNLNDAIAKIREAQARGAQIICLQELFTSQYFCQVEDHKYFQLAEEIPGPSTEALGAVAREKDVVIVASLFEKRGAGLYHNTAAVIDAEPVARTEVIKKLWDYIKANGLQDAANKRAINAEGEKAVPVDIITHEQIETTPSTETNQIIQKVAPSLPIKL